MDNLNENYITELKKVIASTENIKNIEEFFNGLIASNIYIYGAGKAGTTTYQLLQEANINIEGFIDKQADSLKTHLNKPVFKISDNIKDNSFVIIAFLCSNEELEEFKKSLGSIGFKNTCYFLDIYNLIIKKSFVKVTDEKLQLDKNAFTDEQEKILNVANSLCDNKSREVFYNFFKAVMNSNANLFSKAEEGIQYFVDDIPFVKGYSRFVDCGAFDGDTALMLKKCKGKVQKIAMFEPENENFIRLRKNLDKERVAEEEILFPCGVWKSSEMLRFRSGVQSASTISEAGDVYIQCVALDDVIRDFAPTFIKMDIEGAEYEALLGGEKIIKKYTPDLAISVYHRIEHMWEIPLLIKEFNPNYKFYLRCHGLYGMETILYAIHEE